MESDPNLKWEIELEKTLEKSVPDLRRDESIFPPNFLNSLSKLLAIIKERVEPFTEREVAGTMLYLRGFRNELEEKYPSVNGSSGINSVYPEVGVALKGLDKANQILDRVLQRKY